MSLDTPTPQNYSPGGSSRRYNKNRGYSSGGGSNTDKEDNGELESIYNWEQQISKLQDKISKTNVGSDKWEEYNKQLQEAENHLDQLKKKQSFAENKVDFIDTVDESKPTSLRKDINPISTPKATANIIKPSDIVASITKERAAIQNEIESTLKLVDAGVIGKEVGQSYIDGLNDKLKALPSTTKKINNSFSTSSESGINKTADNILSVSSSVTTLASAADKLNLGDSAKNVLSGFSIAAALSQTIGEMMIGYGKQTADAKLGPIGWIAFVATGLSALMAAIATLKSASFASGGIIGGSSFHGDNLIARVNSGEMVLNKRQQHNLFNLLDGGGNSVGGGQVKFVIKGTELQGVLNNYNKKISKIK